MIHPNIEAAKEANACIEGIKFLEENPELSLEELIALDIANETNFTIWYASNVIGGRWLEAEQFVLKDAYSTYRYAKQIIICPPATFDKDKATQ